MLNTLVLGTMKNIWDCFLNKMLTSFGCSNWSENINEPILIQSELTLGSHLNQLILLHVHNSIQWIKFMCVLKLIWLSYFVDTSCLRFPPFSCLFSHRLVEKELLLIQCLKLLGETKKEKCKTSWRLPFKVPRWLIPTWSLFSLNHHR